MLLLADELRASGCNDVTVERPTPAWRTTRVVVGADDVTELTFFEDNDELVYISPAGGHPTAVDDENLTALVAIAKNLLPPAPT
ncbi:hypothetical protein Cch01nite_26850 [Cellulomonas chitinilytica]|uniref:Uncharacterized protein n=1 Tax=Cellulomonas chitinilytica TaxID=398759 RepID=A0A919P5F5_9CELL|nr:hypothetical protein [Cellulomonas chitinilytica]GIG21961.1 hypothetical protein Cch01nite_26850 [Cellulomonas chitinilytica]